MEKDGYGCYGRKELCMFLVVIMQLDKILIYIGAFLIGLSSDWLWSLLVQSISQKLILKSVILNIILSICGIIQIYFVVKQKRIEVGLNILAGALGTYLSLYF